jgi:hypothetical protein
MTVISKAATLKVGAGETVLQAKRNRDFFAAGWSSAEAAGRIRWTYDCYVPRNSHSAGHLEALRASANARVIIDLRHRKDAVISICLIGFGSFVTRR